MCIASSQPGRGFIAALLLVAGCILAQAGATDLGEVTILPNDSPLTTELVTFSVTITPSATVDAIVKFDFDANGVYDEQYTVTKGSAATTVTTVGRVFADDNLQTIVVALVEGTTEVDSEVTFFEPVIKPPADGVNGVDQGSKVSNDDDGLAVEIGLSWDGYIEAIFTEFDTGAATSRAAGGVEVDWGDNSSRVTTGAVQRHNYKQQQNDNNAGNQGIFVMTASKTDEGGSVTKKVRKTLVFGAEDMDEELEEGVVAPDPENRGITGTKISGKFNLENPDKDDKVSVSFELEVPGGLDPKGTNIIDIAVGNITERVTLVKGRAGVTGRYKKVQLKFPKVDKTTKLTPVGFKGVVTVQLTSNDLDESGFDTEGITKSGRVPKPKIQVGARIAGVPFQGSIDTEFFLGKDGESGAIRFAK